MIQVSWQSVLLVFPDSDIPWWRHQMETFSSLLAICAGNSPVPGKFPAQRPVTQSFDVFFDLCLNNRLSKHLWGWWFETPWRSLWRHSNAAWKIPCTVANSATLIKHKAKGRCHVWLLQKDMWIILMKYSANLRNHVNGRHGRKYIFVIQCYINIKCNIWMQHIITR